MLTKLFFGVLMVAMLLSMSSGTAMAAKRVNTWHKTGKDRIFYYDEDGQKLKLKDSRYKINGKYFYFDKDGV